MKCSKSQKLRRSRHALAAAAALAVAGSAGAAPVGSNTDVEINWDNTISYNLGFRASKIDPKIGDSPIYQSSDYKFAKRGDVITNRIGLLSEFDVNVRNRYGMRASASAWKDFAYDDKVEFNPGFIVPGALPYAAASSFSTGRYSSQTRKFYRQGAELLDLFGFVNFDVGGKPVSAKLGRTNVYWGNALFSTFQAISYSQGPIDAIKGAANPGAQVKELFLPRTQVTAQMQLNEEWSLAGQYFFEFRPMRLPEGGTFDGTAPDFLFKNGDQIVTPGGIIRRNADVEPADNHANFGLALRWSPAALGGNIGFYLRQFDEVMPWIPMFQISPAGVPTNYHLAYAQKTKLVGISLDASIASVSTGFELSYRKDTALSSAANPAGLAALGFEGREGARGDVINVVANALATLPRTPIWDTGTLIAEVSATHLVKVSKNADLFRAVGYAGCAVGANKDDGCATRNAMFLAISLTPQWLQVAPSFDLSMPLSLQYGLRGNGANVGGITEGARRFSIGLRGTYAAVHNVSLAYIGSRNTTKGESTLPNGKITYASGNGGFAGNDRDRVVLTYSTTF
jgi:hypothetical protein